MHNTSVENIYTRKAAKELTQKHFGVLAGLLLIATVLPAAVDVILMGILSLTNNAALVSDAQSLVSLATSLLQAALMLGAYNAMLALCRGEQAISLNAVFSRMPYFAKSVGLSLLVVLKLVLWMLPGIFAIAIGPGMGSFDLAASVQIGGIMLICALIIPAALRYAMASYILADKPETRVFDCVKQSKAMMKGRKWQLFKLNVPNLLFFLVIFLVVMVALGSVYQLLGVNVQSYGARTVTMLAVSAASIYYLVRINLCCILFYHKRTEEAAFTESAQTE